MTTRFFPAIIDGDKDTGYGVCFPDLPGCVSSGQTIDETAINAESALLFHLETMLDEGAQIPEPSLLDDIVVDPDINEAARILVKADLPGKVVRVNFTIDEGLLSRIDSAVNRQGGTRSAFLAEAARRAIAES